MNTLVHSWVNVLHRNKNRNSTDYWTSPNFCKIQCYCQWTPLRKNPAAQDIVLTVKCHKISESKFIIKGVTKEQSKTRNEMQIYVKITINEENCQPFGNWRKAMRLWIITLQLTLNKQSKQTNKQTDKQSSLLTLTISYEKSSCLIRSKREKKRSRIKNKREEKKKRKKGIKKLIKMIMEAIIVTISWH